MTPPELRNPFKQAMIEKRPQIGLWLSRANPSLAELSATTGFDWLLIDGEHTPNTLDSVLGHLQAIAAYPGVNPVVRVVENDTARIKQLLDVGAQTLLVPMIDTPEQARQAVAAVRYPPRGVRGVGSGGARASRWSLHGDYLDRADDEICLLIQAETPAALANLEALCEVEGVDGVFIGPSDLSASMGHRGRPEHPDVQAAIEDGLRRIVAAGKAPGILTGNPALARRYLELGACFVAVGIDVLLYAKAARALSAEFRA